MTGIADAYDPLIMPLLKNVLLQRHQRGHDLVLVDVAERDILED